MPQSKVAVVSHDAGGAEVLSSWILGRTGDHCLVLEGPAKHIFQSKLGALTVVSLEDAIKSCDWVLTASSWQSKLEVSAIKLAKESGKYVVTFLEHWINYRERQIHDGALITPDEIWVGDKFSYRIAQDELPEVSRITLVPNPYIDNALKKITRIKRDKVRTNVQKFLYVCENISQHALEMHGDKKHWGYTEFDALRYFFTELNSVYGKPYCYITIRAHPSDSPDKYEFVLSEYPEYTIVLTQKEALIDQIASHDVIVGCNSMAMALGVLSGLRVISCIPDGGRKCVLPHIEIETW